MKKNTNRQARTGLRTLDTAELEKVTGGATVQDAAYHLYTLGADYDAGSGWYEFFNAAGSAAL